MKASDIKEKTNEELVDALQENSDMLGKLRRKHAVSPLENHHEFSIVKKTIARIKTEQRSRELNAAKA